MISLTLVAPALLCVPGSFLQTPLLRELHSALPPNEGQTNDIKVADLDGNGHQDAFVVRGDAIQGLGRARIYFTLGDGCLVDGSADLPPVQAATSVALGDMDGDGDSDAFLGVRSLTLSNQLWRNDGAGRFANDAAAVPPGADGTNDVDMFDYDLDGDLDVLACNILASGDPHQPNQLLVNDGSGKLRVAMQVLPVHPVEFHYAETGAFADFDQDGWHDIVLSLVGFFFPSTYFYRSHEGKHFVYNPGPFGATSRIEVVDVDGDGDSDLGGLWSGWLAINDGTAHFDFQFVPVHAGFGDMDGDGDLDIVQSDGTVQLQTGTLVFESKAPSEPLNSFGRAGLLDVDGDGDLDAVFGQGGLEDVLAWNKGTGELVVATAPIVGIGPISAVSSLGDVDGDGDSDVLVNGTALYLNDGSGGFALQMGKLPPTTGLISGHAARDFDQDGDVDVVLCGAQERLWLGDGAGTFTEVSSAIVMVPSVATTSAVQASDLDGDGDLDLLFANPSTGVGGHNRLQRNAGSLQFLDVSASKLPALVANTVALAVGDVDLDGDVDVIWGNKDEQNWLMLNDGAAGFSDATAQMPIAITQTAQVLLEDMDGDGDLDALNVGGIGGSRLDRNDGNGHFSLDPGAFPEDGSSVSNLAVFDVDLDGDRDALSIGGHYSGVTGVFDTYKNRLLLNDGSGRFEESPLGAFAEQNKAVAVDDFDGDGDLDALVANGYRVRVLTNLKKQIAWRCAPSVGDPFTIDLFGSPSSPWILGWSTGTTLIPLSELGILKLDPVGSSVAGSGFLSSDGLGSMTFVAPTSTAAIGLSIYWQAALGSPLALSNLELTTFGPQ